VTVTLIARILLVALFTCFVGWAIRCHGKPFPRGAYHAFPAIGAVGIEATLIWLAGGFG